MQIGKVHYLLSVYIMKIKLAQNTSIVRPCLFSKYASLYVFVSIQVYMWWGGKRHEFMGYMLTNTFVL